VPEGGSVTEATRRIDPGDFWNERLLPYCKADDRKAVLQLASTAGLFALAWWAMFESLAIGWWVPLLVAPFASGLLVRLFIIQHDCGHGSFFTSRKLNDNVGVALGVLTLTPYYWWKRSHAIHHATSSDLDRRSVGDIATLTVNEYLGLPLQRRLAYRLYRNPLVMLVLGPLWIFVIKHRLPYETPRAWRREWRDVLLNDAALVAIVVLIWRTMGLGSFLMVHGPVFMLSAAAGVWLFYVQHQFEDTVWTKNADWNFFDAGLRGSSFYDLPVVLHWFTGNIGYHHVHHLASRIPNYKLALCFREVEELQQVPRLGLRQSLGCLRLKLWDEASERMVGFPRSNAAHLVASSSRPQSSGQLGL
jgi:omega-6 fatty acid desaturase (delta-12 desaturase)